MHVIGIPVSIASEPLVGNNSYADHLLLKILKEEKGLILGLNFKKDYCINKVLNLRTLPTIILKNEFKDSFEFLDMMRHPYRRKLKLHSAKFREVTTTESSCRKFTPEHLQLYLNIMKKTTTKLEVLSLDFFQNLPSNFILTTHSFRDIMLAWQICAIDNNNLFFFFGGINYDKRD